MVAAAGTYDGKATKIYVNGAKMGNAGHSGDFGVNGAPILIRYRLRDMFFEGIIDDVAIDNRALTEKEIRTDMEEGVLPLAVQSTEKLSTT